MVLAALVAAAPPALGFELCDRPGVREEFALRLEAWKTAFAEKRFDDLDRYLNGFLAQMERRAVSDAEVRRAFAIFESPLPGSEPLHMEWLRQHPDSPAALLAIAYHYSQRWIAAGRDEDLRDALRAFDLAAARVKVPTLSVAGKIRIAYERSGAARLDMTPLYRAAIAKYPQTLEARIQYIRASSPRSGGSMARLEANIADAAGLTEPDRRYLTYLVMEEMGKAAEAAGDDAGAARLYRKVVPDCPGLDGALWALVAVDTRLKRFGELIPLLTKFIESHPRDARAYSSRGLAYREVGKMADAYSDYQRAVELGDGPALMGLGWFFETGTHVARDRRKARELYELAANRYVEGAQEKMDRLRLE
jgi:tetratricopeptide (TPR) repeat protein